MKYIFTLVNLILIFLGTNALVTAFYTYHSSQWVHPPAMEKAPRKKAPDLVAQKVAPQSHYRKVAQRDLFKTGARKSKPSPVKKAPRPKPTALKLMLRGTIVGTGAAPMAIIATPKDKKGKAYRQGDVLDRARIKTILRQRVILVVNGKQEILMMQNPKAKGAPPLPPIPKPLETKPKSQGSGEFNTQVSLSLKDVETLKSQLPALKKQVRVRPHFHKGTMDGFRLTNIKKKSVFYGTLGLRNGDIISAVNDKKLKSVSDVKNIYGGLSQIKGDLSTDIKIKRKGESGTIRYAIN